MLLRVAWRNLWRHARRTVITASAIALGMAFTLPMFALIDGSYGQVFEIMVTRSIGHAQIHDRDYPQKRSLWETVDDAGALQEDLDGLPGVSGTTVRLYGQTLLGTDEESVGAVLIGVDPAREDALTGLSEDLVSGRYLSPAPGREAILGRKLAERLDVEVGDEIIAVTQAADGSIGNDLYTVVGTYQTGSVAKDRSAAYLHLSDLQDLLVLPGQVHEVAIVAADVEDPAGLASAADVARDRGLLFRRWDRLEPQLAAMLDAGEAVSAIFLLLILGIAGIGVLNTMLMSVYERTRELGVLRAIGLRPRQVVWLIVLETLSLMAVALAIGLPLGLALDAWLVLKGLDLSVWIGDYSFAGADLDPMIYGVFEIDGVITTVVGLFAIALGAALWPAWRAARLRPVDAMRMD